MSHERFARELDEHRRARLASVGAPHGTASLRHTHWLGAEAGEFAGAPGRWRADGSSVLGTGLAPVLDSGEDAVRLAPGDELRAGGLLLRAFERDGALALRVFDPASPGRLVLEGIDAYPAALDLVVTGRFAPAAEGERLDVAAVDGHVSSDPLGGVVEFALDGVPLTLTVTPSGDAYFAVFADATSGEESYRFRFLRVEAPAADGTTTLDFNRAYLPPCAFSDQYVCPLPPLGNRWPVAVRAGERMPVRRAAAA